MMFPTAGSTIYRNEDGEPTGWDRHPPCSEDDPDDFYERDVSDPDGITLEECERTERHGGDGDGTEIPGVYRCIWCGETYRSAWESFYASQDVDEHLEVATTWSVYREWYASQDDDGEPWGQERVSTHPDETTANGAVERLYRAAHPEVITDEAP